ncbi:MAG: hypothetical protein KAI24_18195 [Planctomycetes bacterium]|nr:hypothetical protein [Planctomycetota bacterium]
MKSGFSKALAVLGGVVALLLVAAMLLWPWGANGDSRPLAPQRTIDPIVMNAEAAERASSAGPTIEAATATRTAYEPKCELLVTSESGEALNGVIATVGSEVFAQSGGTGSIQVPGEFAHSQGLLSCPGFLSTSIRLPAAGTVASFRLSRAFELVVHVVDIGGRGVAGVTVRAEQVPAKSTIGEAQAESGADGRCELANLCEGQYRIALDSTAVVCRRVEGGTPGMGRGVYQVPSENPLTIVVERPTIMCLQVEGDELVWLSVSRRFGESMFLPGVAKGLRKLRSEILAAHPRSKVATWIPAEDVASVEVRLFLRHSGWRSWSVPTYRAGDYFEPFVITAPRVGADLTGTLEVEMVGEFDSAVPLTVTSEATGDEAVSSELRSGEPCRLPLGRYRIGMSPLLGQLENFVVITPREVELTSAARRAKVEVATSIRIVRAACTVFWEVDGKRVPATGRVEVMHAGRRVGMVATWGRLSPTLAWLPAGVELEWRMRRLNEGQVEELRSTYRIGNDVSSVHEIVLR